MAPVASFGDALRLPHSRLDGVTPDQGYFIPLPLRLH